MHSKITTTRASAGLGWASNVATRALPAPHDQDRGDDDDDDASNRNADACGGPELAISPAIAVPICVAATRRSDHRSDALCLGS